MLLQVIGPRSKAILSCGILLILTTSQLTVSLIPDDMIKSSAYRIGPGEIETVLNQYHTVLESAVIGKPDKLRGSIIKAFIVLKPQYQNNENMVNDIMQFVKNRLATYAYPKEIEFIDNLPKTSNGKIKRYLLKN